MNASLLTPGLIAAVLILGLYLLARTQAGRNLAILLIMGIGIAAAFFTFAYSEQQKAIAGIEARTDAAGYDIAHVGGLEMRALRYIEALEDSLRAGPDTAASLADYASLRSAYDMLRDSLGQEIAREELQVSMNGQIIQVALQTDVTFETGRAILSLRGEQTLRRAKSGIAEALQRLPGHIVRVEGHADSRPLSVEMYFEDYDRYALDFTNWELSTLRAVSAARFLQEELRLPAERLQVVGWSEYHPRATNRTAAGRAMNRRIDLIIAPIEEPSLLPKRPG